MTLREQALRYGSLMVAAFALGTVAPVVSVGPMSAQVALADELTPDTDPGFDENGAYVNQFVSGMFPTLPTGTFRGNYVATGTGGTGLATGSGQNVFDPFASKWLGDLANASGLSGNAAFEAAFKSDPSSVKILGVSAVSGATVKWDGKYLYVKADDPSIAGQFDLYTNFGTFRSQVWGATANVIVDDSAVDVRGYKLGSKNVYDIPFEEFLKSANSADAQLLWASLLGEGSLKIHRKKGFVRVKSDDDIFQISWIAGDGRTTDGGVFTGYTQASPAGGTASGAFF
jgi:hypothetical protein